MSSMLHMLQQRNPNIEYPSYLGKLWSKEEEDLLLTRIKDNIDINVIASTHNRTVGGIRSRIREIAYKLYKANVSIIEISNKTKLSELEINDIIKRRGVVKNHKNDNSDIVEIKNEINELKRDVKEILRLMNALYDFEES